MRIPNEAGQLGRYDTECESLLMELQAHAAVVMIIGGVKGGGFSVSTRDPRLTLFLPALLEDMARKIRAQNAQTPDE
jgi:hypothetical protein